MQKRSKRMALLISLAKRSEEVKAKELQQVEQILIDQKARLTELDEYYNAYNRECGVMNTRLRVQDLVSSRGLLQRLSDAKRQQSLNIKDIETRREQARQQWYQSHLKVQSFEDLKQRREKEEQSVLDIAEQKKVDEWSVTAFYHRRNE